MINVASLLGAVLCAARGGRRYKAFVFLCAKGKLRCLGRGFVSVYFETGRACASGDKARKTRVSFVMQRVLGR